MNAGLSLELHRHRLSGIAEEMGDALTLAALSPNIKERRDHSCALFDAQGRMVAQAAHIPVHLGAAPRCVAAVLERLQLEDGQTAIVNDPWAGGTHLPDITLVTAVDLGEGERMYVANRAHHADVGGISPGSLPISRTIDDEGWRTPPVLLTEAVEASLLAASRTPEERRGDLSAQRSANRVGRLRLQALARELGPRTLVDLSNGLLSWSEARVRAWLKALGDVQTVAEDWLDDADGHGPPVRLHVALTVHDGRLALDFSGSDDQVEGPMNAVRAIVDAAVFYLLLTLVGDDVPATSGLLAPATLTTRRGSVLDADPPAAVAAGNVETSQRLVDLLQHAFAPLVPDRMPAASCGSMNNLLIGSASNDPVPWVYYETIGGGHGGGPLGPGASGMHAHMTNTLNTPVEALEHAWPMRVTACGLRSRSGGEGRFPGGEGMVREVEVLVPAVVTVLGERHRRAPLGRDGGGEGAPGEHWHIPLQGDARRLPGKATLELKPGERIRVLTPGGGGWGRSE